MELQSAYCRVHNQPPIVTLSPSHRRFSHHNVSSSYSVWNKISERLVGLRFQTPRFRNAFDSYTVPSLKRTIKKSSLPSLSRGFVVCASSSDADAKLNLSGQETTGVSMNAFDRAEPFRGKSGYVSFNGLTHQLVEEGRLVSAPFNENAGSFLWVLAPVALILSMVVPQFFLGIAVDGLLQDEILSEIVASFSSEVMFYVGLVIFLHVTDHVQKPYLQYSPKRWGLITGFTGYLTSAFFTMGLKVFAPLFAVYVTWPVLGLPALVSVAPFLAGCLAQLAFEKHLLKRGSSCWPLVPIIFEVYRLYQLSKAAHFIEKLMMSMKGLPVSPEVLERSGALVAMLVTFQVLGLVCLWSLLTFLQRLFPSRPVAENY